jgi:hypothetical protein
MESKMRPTKASRRRRHLKEKEIDPVFRTTWDGRPLLPQEVPIIAVQEVVEAGTDPLVAALAMFDDMLSRPAPRVATPIEPVDRWGMIREGDSGPVLLEAMVDEVLAGEPTVQEGAPAVEMATDGWGDSGDLIEEWFRTGEYLTPEPPESDPPITWFGALVQRVRRAWPGRRESAESAWNAA